MMKVKRRSLGQLTWLPSYDLHARLDINGPIGPFIEETEPGKFMKDQSMQVTASESHARDRHGFYHSGGPFYTESRRFVSKNQIEFIGRNDPFTVHRYKGPILPLDPHSLEAFFSSLLSRPEDTSDLDPDGAIAVSRCSPVNPVDTLGQGIAELHRDGLPSLPGVQSWRRRAEIVRAAGEEFLNVVFGWKPLVSEVKDFSSTVRNSRDLLLQYHRNQGSNVSRAYRFPVSESHDTEPVLENLRAWFAQGLGGDGEGFRNDPIYPWHTANNATLYLDRKVTVSKWFKGSFTYAVPSQSDSWRRMLGYGSDADKLYGIALTPELLWNIAPWSWAVDWFSNAGDVIRNISNFAGAGQVMRYGYIMEEKSTTIRLFLDRSGVFKGTAEVQAPSCEYQLVSKVRRPANPYGFGISSGDLSPLQIAIVAALGITLL